VSGLHDRSTVLGFGVGQDELGQMLRLRRFREKHPDVIIGDGGFGTIQARIPEPSGETVVTRYRLGELLDNLGQLLGDHPDEPGTSG
jgi:hypothetical protein